MQWIVFFIGVYFWSTAYSDWGWSGFSAFIFACVCVGVIIGIWEAIFGMSKRNGNGNISNDVSKEDSGSGLADTALKLGAGYGIGKLTGKKTYAFQCWNCDHYEERSQRIKTKCPKCGSGSVQVSKI